MSEETDFLKQQFIDEYKKNGGKDNITDLSVNEVYSRLLSQKREGEAQKKIKELQEQLKTNATSNQPSTPLGAVNGAVANAAFAKEVAAAMTALIDHLDPPFDSRILEDESFKKNANKLGDTNVILRDDAGRMDMGGPTKYKPGGEIQWSAQ